MIDSDIQSMIDEYSGLKELSEKSHLGLSICDKLWNTGSYEDARKYGYEALEIAEKLDDKVLIFDILTSVGISYAIQGEYLKAKEIFEKSYLIAQKIQNTKMIIKAYINLGNIELNISNNQGAVNFYFEAVRLCEEINYTDLLAKLYNNIGNVYVDLGKCKEALEYLKKSLKVLKPSDSPANIFYNIGNLYKKEKNFALALGYFKRAFTMFEENKNIHYMIYCYLVTGEIYVEKEQYSKAETCAIKSLELSKKHKLDFYAADAYFLLAETYNKLDDYKRALEHYHLVFELVDSVENQQLLMSFYQCYSEFNHKYGNDQEAYQSFLKYNEIKDKIYNQDLLKNIAVMTANFDYEQNKKELEISRLKNIELVKSQKLIEQQKEELIKLNKSKDNILSMISHDLKNYIGSIKSALEIATLKDKSLSENKYLMMIEDLNEKAYSLVKDILEMNKLEFDNILLEKIPLDINEKIKHIKDNLIFIAKQKDISLSFEFCENPLFCMINLDKFHRIIDNLCINAVKFTHPKGSIKIKTSQTDDSAVISFVDTGIGIAEDLIPHLFEKYSKLSRKGTLGEESTGLGLYIVKKLIDLHNGEIEVRSSLGKGSEFVVKIPLFK